MAPTPLDRALFAVTDRSSYLNHASAGTLSRPSVEAGTAFLHEHAAIGSLGCEYAMTGEQRVKLVMSDGLEVRDIYKLAAERNVQIRRLNYKRDSLEDIFLKAME